MRPESFSLNPYEVLGVSPNASNQEIQAAYRQHALRWHPDRNPNDEYSMRMMQRVNAAWAILKDEDRRAAFDRQERGETRSASGPQAWRRPHADASPGGEWYRPPPRVVTCPRCDSSNDEGSVYCYSCGYPFDEEGSNKGTPANDYSPEHDTRTNSSKDRPASFRRRFITFAIDNVILFFLALGVASVFDVRAATWWSEATPSDLWSFGAFDWINLVMGAMYFTFMVAALSTTLGKISLGLVVLRKDGSKVSVVRAFIRYLCYYLSFILLGIGFLMIAFSRDKRGLHDLICDTKVVYR